MLRLPVVEPGDYAAVPAGLVEDPLDALVTCAGDLEVDGVNAVRDVQAVLLLVPMARAAFDDLGARSRLSRLPLHS